MHCADPLGQIVILALGFAQVYTGFGQWGKPGTIPSGVVPAWGVLVAFWSIVYLAGFSLLPRQWRERQAEAAPEKGGDNYEVGIGRSSSAAALARPNGDTIA